MQTKSLVERTRGLRTGMDIWQAIFLVYKFDVFFKGRQARISSQLPLYPRPVHATSPRQPAMSSALVAILEPAELLLWVYAAHEQLGHQNEGIYQGRQAADSKPGKRT